METKEVMNQQCLQLTQQLVELQRENNALRMEMLRKQPNKCYGKKPERPVIELHSTDGDWAVFLDAWSRYKDMCEMTDPVVIRNELRITCTPELNRLLFDLMGPETLNTATEEQLLQQIKLITVRGLHKEVYRQEFHSMRQEEGETITHFLARLRAVARFCGFVVVCPNEKNCGWQVNYSSDMVAGQMVAGLANAEHQSKILAEASNLTTLERKFDRLVSLEATAKSTPHLYNTTHPVAVSGVQKSDPKRQLQNVNTIRTPRYNWPCKGCGRTSHPNGSMDRKDCPAAKMVCFFCGRIGHAKRVCQQLNRGSVNRATTTGSKEESCTFSTKGHTDSFSGMACQNTQRKWRGKVNPAQANAVPHLIWNGNRFQRGPPDPPPSLTIEITLIPEAHAEFGHASKKVSNLRTHRITAVPDTGAQTCSSGPELQKVLGCPDRFLVPTRHRIRGITEAPLQIKGVIFARIRVGSRETHQMIYVSENTTGFYLSESALKDLGILSCNFPNPPSKQNVATSDNGKAPCGCPRRTAVPSKPANIPFAPTEENKIHLKQWILKHFSSSTFNTCPHQPLQTMKGKPLDIAFIPGTKPIAVHTPIPVPHHWKKKVKQDIDRDVALGIIEPVPVGTPTTWCSRMVVAPKKDGSPRRTVDLQKLNAATMRETHHTPSPFNQASLIPAHMRKTILDAWNGYHSLPLSPNARDATTFITEWGRYRYLRAPQGFHASGDAYTRRFDDITIDMTRKTRCIDDTILWDDSIETSFWHTIDYITHCGDNGIVFNPEKFHFAEKEIDFAGFRIMEDGIKPTKKMTEAIANFPTPTNITNIRSWFGLVNQVSYAFSQAEIMAPFRELLKTKDRKFYWDDMLDQAFEESKRRIVREIEEGVKTFEVNRPTCLSTDFSKTGIGYFLFQKHCNCATEAGPICGKDHWKLILAGSRFTSDAESRYAPVEGEALALVYGLEACRMFVLGCPELLVTVDHKPLIKIFSDKALEDIKNPRLFSLKERSLMYKFNIKHLPGKLNAAPDCTSRYPSTPKLDTALIINSAIKASFSSTYEQDPKLRAITWDRIRAAAATDEECRSLVEYVQKGFPKSRHELPEIIRRFWPMKETLYSLEGVVIMDSKILIPRKLRGEVLESLHSAHQGVNGMLANARQRLFWPGLDASIRQTRAQCKICNTMAPSQPREPLMPPPNPEFPFQMTVTDFFDMQGKNYMVYADRYTGWVEVARMSSGNARATCDALRKWFCTYGVPQEISSDGGPPFDSQEYNQFLKNWGIKKRISSAYYPQSNGRAELAVKTAKRVLADNIDSYGRLCEDRAAMSLLTHRNTPVQGLDMSPAMMLYGRVIKDHLPALQEKYRIHKRWSEISRYREMAMAKRHIANEKYYNPHSRPLRELEIGQSVQIQNQIGSYPRRWTKTGRVVERLGNRQYHIRVDGSNRVTRRNRRFLREIDPVVDTQCLPPSEDIPMISDQTKRPEPLDTSQEEMEMEVDDVDCQDRREVPTMMEIDEDPYEMPPDRGLRRSTRRSRPPRNLSPQTRGTSHEYSRTSQQVTTNRTICGPMRGGHVE